MRPLQTLVAALALSAACAAPAAADRIRNPTAIFSGLDKVTGRIISFEVAIDETVQFGALQLTPKVCWTRPPTEAPHTTAFIEVDEVTLDNEYRRIFNGWMFAASPGLNAIDHAVYDVWLTDCKGGTEIVVETKEATPDPLTPPERPGGREANPAQAQGRRDIVPQQGVPVAPQQEPSRRFFPTNEPQPQQRRQQGPIRIGPDPTGSGSQR